MKILAFIARLLFIISLPALFISAAIGWGANSIWLYNYGFEKYGVSRTTGLPAAELEKVASGLIGYFNSSEEYASITVTKDGKPFPIFTREEALHFKDVKDLFQLDYAVFLAALIYALAFALVCILWHRPMYRRWLARSAVRGSAVALGMMLLLGAGALLDFQQLFLQFHFLAFTNPYWSAPGYMLLLFPGGFWFDAAIICSALAAGLAVVTGVVALVYLKRSRIAISHKLREGVGTDN